MSRPIIVCDRISKHYKLGASKKTTRMWAQADHTLAETVRTAVQGARDFVMRTRSRASSEHRSFWALKDVSFEIGRGEVVGIVGRNGAGKSTLLKILSRIVEPTGGNARLRGRVASLLEVGTGFHMELTGRENIYLNGAILGMKKAEIDRKFDEIVAFSEIKEFLDTPSKRYSSGMMVRLAFAVAAHLEPEILIVDEVLAVGDFAFQKKCLGKIHDVATGDGRTILFVSHNMGALAQLCDRGILLEHGSVSKMGSIQDIIKEYFGLEQDRSQAQSRFPIVPEKTSQWISAEVLHEDGMPGTTFECDEPIRIRLRYEVRKPVSGTFLHFALFTIDGIQVLFSDYRDGDPSIAERLGPGLHTFEIRIPARLLAPTAYTINLAAIKQFGDHQGNHYLDAQSQCGEFTVRDLRNSLGDRPGVLGVLLPWEHQHQAEPLEACVGR
jgi:lipopolysaccharide transport system ATP-binding protein